MKGKNKGWRGKMVRQRGLREILRIKGEDEGWRNKMKEEKGKR